MRHLIARRGGSAARGATKESLRKESLRKESLPHMGEARTARARVLPRSTATPPERAPRPQRAARTVRDRAIAAPPPRPRPRARTTSGPPRASLTGREDDAKRRAEVSSDLALHGIALRRVALHCIAVFHCVVVAAHHVTLPRKMPDAPSTGMKQRMTSASFHP